MYSILLRLLILYQIATVEKLKSSAFYKLNWFQIALLKMFRFGASRARSGRSSSKNHSSTSRSQMKSFITSALAKSSTKKEEDIIKAEQLYVVSGGNLQNEEEVI